MFANYPVLALNHEVAASEPSFSVLQALELGCGQNRFDVVSIDIARRSTGWVVTQDAVKLQREMRFHRSLLFYRLKSQPWGNWYSPLEVFKYGLAQCRLYYHIN